MPDEIERNRVGRWRGRADRGAQLAPREHHDPLPPIGARDQVERRTMTADNGAGVELIDRRGGCTEPERLYRGIDTMLDAAGPALRAHQGIAAR